MSPLSVNDGVEIKLGFPSERGPPPCFGSHCIYRYIYVYTKKSPGMPRIPNATRWVGLREKMSKRHAAARPGRNTPEMSFSPGGRGSLLISNSTPTIRRSRPSPRVPYPECAMIRCKSSYCRSFISGLLIWFSNPERTSDTRIIFRLGRELFASFFSYFCWTFRAIDACCGFLKIPLNYFDESLNCWRLNDGLHSED